MIVAASLPTLSGLAQAPAGKKSSGEKWAILIGIDDYLNAGDLKYCGADQRSLKDQLIRSGFDERQVFLLDDEAKDRKLLPFKANVERQLQTVLGFAERGDFILLAFSGHGVHFNKVSYLCPIDAKLDDPSTLISMDWVYEQLGKSKADLRLVMVDACRNDPRPEGQRSMSPKELREGTRQFVETSDQRLPEGIVLLHSCSEGEVSQEDKDFGHGVFMHYVLEGLAGKADKDGDQIVSFNELVRYTSKETKLFVEKRYNDSQRPKLKGNLTGDVLDFGLSSLLNAPRQPQHDAPASEQRRSEFSNSLGMKLVPFKAG
ncbi:MAG: caspase family protein, partial [Pirellulaceae bacterium]|nr:caspase family protein [Pirellulaceae bacterium]